MDANGLIILATTGGAGVAIAIVVALALIGRRRRLDGPTMGRHDEATAAALAEIQSDIDKGQRGF